MPAQSATLTPTLNSVGVRQMTLIKAILKKNVKDGVVRSKEMSTREANIEAAVRQQHIRSSER